MAIERFLVSFGSKSTCPTGFRIFLFKLAGITIGDQACIRSGFHADRPKGVAVGRGSFINRFVHIFNGFNKNTTVTIGNDVFIGPDTRFVCVSHEIGDESKRAGSNTYGSIVVEDGAWIGTNVTILPGVKIARGCVIGSGAVVTKSTSPNGVYYGVPAKRIRDIVLS